MDQPQWPIAQDCVRAQTVPQFPQCVGSTIWFTQPTPGHMMQPPAGHANDPASWAVDEGELHTQFPPLHVPSGPHVLPHEPQLDALDERSKQRSSQLVVPLGHMSAHALSEQTGWPHWWSTPPPPQVSGSVHVVGQSIVAPHPSG